MKHSVGDGVTIEYDSENREWVGGVTNGDLDFETRSVELTQVMFDLEELGELEPQSFEWSNRGGIEQVLVVVPAETGTGE